MPIVTVQLVTKNPPPSTHGMFINLSPGFHRLLNRMISVKISRVLEKLNPTVGSDLINLIVAEEITDGRCQDLERWDSIIRDFTCNRSTEMD
uniref:Uncharacterized protein n=1 Tax=Cannabis sativa TaxID=3483 RepID=A0A803NUM9_CANSA